jgi:Class II histone deacetylase complex subunits 2 and 3
MPETRRSIRGGPTTTTSAPDDTESPVRKSLRGMRNEAAAKRAELKVKAQKLAEQKRNGSDLSKPVSRSDSIADSETGSSVNSMRGRGRKSRQVDAEDMDSTKNNAQSEHQDDAESTGKLTNGEDASSANLDPVQRNTPPTVDEEMVDSSIPQDQEQDQPQPKPQVSNMEFIVPMPLMPQSADHYCRTVTSNKHFIEEFTARKSPPPEMVLEAEVFVQKMRDICLHIDLVNDTIEDGSDVTPDIRAVWDRSTSSKFKFLYHILESLRERDLHMAIFCKSRLLDLVESFLAGNDVSYDRPDKGVSVQTSKGYSVIVTLRSSDDDSLANAEISRPADAVISLDNTLDASKPTVRNIRSIGDLLSPLISLVVLNSVDHIDRYMSSAWVAGVEKLQAEIACITKLRQEAGRMGTDYQNVEEVASLVSLFLTQPERTEIDWAIAPLGPLDDNEAWDLANGNTVLLQTSTTHEHRQKRSRETSTEKEDLPAIKKTKVGDDTDDNDNSKIIDSVVSSQPPKSSQDDSEERVAALKKVEDEHKTLLREKDAMVRDRDSRIRTIETDFDMQMNRFEDQSRKLIEVQGQLEKVTKDLEDANERRVRREEFVTKLKDENLKLKEDLKVARLALESSEIPEVSELERLRREKEEAEKAKQKAEKDLKMEQEMSGYLRTEYMKASTLAMELRNSNDELLAKISNLEVKANGEAARLKQLGMDQQTKSAFREIDRLKAELKNRETLLARKEEELKVKRSGIGTRAGSVPRSPRVGPTNSRAASPIPDRRIENLKNSNNL